MDAAGEPMTDCKHENGWNRQEKCVDCGMPWGTAMALQKPPPTEVYSRWKYAEEAAYDLIKAGHLIRLTMRPDVEHLDTDGEVYVYDDFVVEDLGPR